MDFEYFIADGYFAMVSRLVKLTGENCVIDEKIFLEITIIYSIAEILNFTQPIYVGRDDPDSRQKTIQDIIDRTTSKEDWAQV